MSFVVNLNGTISPVEQVTISVLDRGFLYGDSVYEVIRTYGGRPFCLDQHLARLNRSAERLGISLPDQDHLVAEIERTIETAANEESYCRIIVTRGSGPLTLDPTTAEDPVLVILVKAYTPFEDWMYQKGIRVYVPSVRRTSPQALDPAIKSGNYLNSVLALGEARKAGFDDALLLDRQGLVTEATSANVFIYRKNRLITPQLETGLLAGVTRGLVIGLARQNGMILEERDLRLDEMLEAEEVMLTSTLREVMPVVQIGDHQIARGTPGPIAPRLRSWVRDYAQQWVLGPAQPVGC